MTTKFVLFSDLATALENANTASNRTGDDTLQIRFPHAGLGVLELGTSQNGVFRAFDTGRAADLLRRLEQIAAGLEPGMVLSE